MEKMHRLPHNHQIEEERNKCFDIAEVFYNGPIYGTLLVSLGGSKYFMLVKDRNQVNGLYIDGSCNIPMELLEVVDRFIARL